MFFYTGDVHCSYLDGDDCWNKGRFLQQSHTKEES